MNELDVLHSDVKRLRALGVSDEDIRIQFINAGLSEADASTLVGLDFKPIVTEKVKESQTPLDMLRDLDIFLDRAEPELWKHHRQPQYRTLCDLRTYRAKIKEVLSARRR